MRRGEQTGEVDGAPQHRRTRCVHTRCACVTAVRQAVTWVSFSGRMVEHVARTWAKLRVLGSARERGRDTCALFVHTLTALEGGEPVANGDTELAPARRAHLSPLCGTVEGRKSGQLEPAALPSGGPARRVCTPCRWQLAACCGAPWAQFSSYIRLTGSPGLLCPGFLVFGLD